MEQASGDVACFFHYTSRLGFENITAESKKTVEIFVLCLADVIVLESNYPRWSDPSKASLVTEGEKANAWWGQGEVSRESSLSHL